MSQFVLQKQFEPIFNLCVAHTEFMKQVCAYQGRKHGNNEQTRDDIYNMGVNFLSLLVDPRYPQAVYEAKVLCSEVNNPPDKVESADIVYDCYVKFTQCAGIFSFSTHDTPEYTNMHKVYRPSEFVFE